VVGCVRCRSLLFLRVGEQGGGFYRGGQGWMRSRAKQGMVGRLLNWLDCAYITFKKMKSRIADC
jgi:hypothetical protein